jgi:hypothetical protein
MGAIRKFGLTSAIAAIGLSVGAMPAQANRHCSVAMLIGKKFCADVIGTDLVVDRILIKSSVAPWRQVRLVGQYPTGVKHTYHTVMVPGNENKLYCDNPRSYVWDYRKTPCAYWPSKAKIDVEYYENGRWVLTDFFTIEKAGLGK